MGAAVRFVNGAGDQARGFHALHQRGHRIRVAAHELGQFLLRQAVRIPFVQPAQDRELVRREPEMGNPLAENLVQAIPRPAQQWGQAARCFLANHTQK